MTTPRFTFDDARSRRFPCRIGIAPSGRHDTEDPPGQAGEGVGAG